MELWHKKGLGVKSRKTGFQIFYLWMNIFFSEFLSLIIGLAKK